MVGTAVPLCSWQPSALLLPPSAGSFEMKTQTNVVSSASSVASVTHPPGQVHELWPCPDFKESHGNDGGKVTPGTFPLDIRGKLSQ